MRVRAVEPVRGMTLEWWSKSPGVTRRPRKNRARGARNDAGPGRRRRFASTVPAPRRAAGRPRLFGLAGFLRLQLLADARRLAGTPAQVVELRAPHVALALQFDRGDQRRVRLERALDAFAAADLAHDERRVEAAVALRDHHALVGLHALAFAFDDVHV